jgi:hypothetical protein
MLKSVVRPQDFILSLDVDIVNFRLHQTRPRVIGTIGSNSSAPATPLSSSGSVLPSGLAARVDDLTQNLDKRHVGSSSSDPPSRHPHTALLRRLVDRFQILRRSNKDSTNYRGHAPRRGHRPYVNQGLFGYSHTDPVRPSGFHHLHDWQGNSAGPKEEMLCATRVLLFESV